MQGPASGCRRPCLPRPVPAPASRGGFLGARPTAVRSAGPHTQRHAGPSRLWPYPHRSQATSPPPPISRPSCRGARVFISPHHFCPRVTKKKKTGKKKKTRSDEEASPLHPAYAQHAAARRGDGDSHVSGPGLGRASPDTQEEAEGPGSTAEGSERAEPSQMGLLIPGMKDTAVERVGQPLSKVIDQLNGQLDPRSWRPHVEPSDHSFRTGSPGGAPERPPSCDFSEGLPAPMDFYRFTVESPSTVTSGGSDHDPAGPGQPLHVPGGPAAAGQEEAGGGGEGQAPRPLRDSSGEDQEPEPQQLETQLPLVIDGPVPEPEPGTQEALCQLKRDQPSPCLSSAEDSGVEEGQGSPSEMTHSAEFR